MPRRSRAVSAFLGQLLLCGPALGAPLPSFTPFAPLSQATGISADGTVVIGYGGYGIGSAWYWTAGTGVVLLTGSVSGLSYDEAFGISADGSTIVGNGASRPGIEAYRWRFSGERDALGSLLSELYSFATATSMDGSVVVGRSGSPTTSEAFRWTPAGGMVGLGDLPGGGVYSVAHDVSGDGAVVVGETASADYGVEAFLWTEAGGMIGLGAAFGDDFQSVANAVSQDGSIVVGMSAFEAVRWTAADGPTRLGFLPGHTISSARDLSADGSVVVGLSRPLVGDDDAFFWTESRGMTSLRGHLISRGLDLEEWILEEAVAVSADGLTIVGYGRDPDDQRIGWIAVIPEPSSGALLAAGLSLLCLRVRRARRSAL